MAPQSEFPETLSGLLRKRGWMAGRREDIADVKALIQRIAAILRNRLGPLFEDGRGGREPESGIVRIPLRTALGSGGFADRALQYLTSLDAPAPDGVGPWAERTKSAGTDRDSRRPARPAGRRMPGPTSAGLPIAPAPPGRPPPARPGIRPKPEPAPTITAIESIEDDRDRRAIDLDSRLLRRIESPCVAMLVRCLFQDVRRNCDGEKEARYPSDRGNRQRVRDGSRRAA